jgi:sugar phosphate isomerase/epimerase
MKRRAFLMTAATVPLIQAGGSEGKSGMRLGVITTIANDPEAGVKRVRDLGFPTCQLYAGSFDPGIAKRLRAALDSAGIEATALIAAGSGPEVYDFYQGPLTIGLLPRQYREARLAGIRNSSDFAKLCGIPAVQTHCGFIPENPNDPAYKEVVAAIREAALYCKQNGQSFRCETGQETPITLLRAIRDAGVDGLGVNFDAGNLILYGKANPVDAVEVLAPYIQGVHAKDGLYPTNPKELGQEVPIGQGKANFPVLIQKLKEAGYRGALTIEREIEGEKQTQDILASKAYLEKLI